MHFSLSLPLFSVKTFVNGNCVHCQRWPVGSSHCSLTLHVLFLLLLLILLHDSRLLYIASQRIFIPFLSSSSSSSSSVYFYLILGWRNKAQLNPMMPWYAVVALASHDITAVATELHCIAFLSPLHAANVEYIPLWSKLLSRVDRSSNTTAIYLQRVVVGYSKERKNATCLFMRLCVSSLSSLVDIR